MRVLRNRENIFQTMNRQHEDMVCAASAKTLRKANWWDDSERNSQLEIANSKDDQLCDSDMDGIVAEGEREILVPHKAAFHQYITSG